MHVSVDWYPKWQDVVTNTNRLATLGLDVHITEMDVRIKDPAREEELVEQARVYRDMLRVCLSAQNCKALALWGFTDRHSWIPFFFEGWDAALIFDKSYCPKPAYYAILDELAGCWVEGPFGANRGG